MRLWTARSAATKVRHRLKQVQVQVRGTDDVRLLLDVRVGAVHGSLTASGAMLDLERVVRLACAVKPDPGPCSPRLNR